ncbi:MAG: carbohydrate-binding domain-containing protein [Spirochaetes bacterium]|nr:carbohydrate-binding domain-containing protein [Spirochaetota bacterium]
MALLAALLGSSTPSSTTAEGTRTDTSNPDDVVSNITFDYNITIDLSAKTAQLGSDTAQDFTSVAVTPLTGVTISTASGVTITSTVTEKIKYVLTGTLSGTLIVNSSSAYQLYLNGASITATAGPAIDLESSQKVYIVTASGTSNTLADTKSRTLTMKGALFGNGPMIFSGEGTLSITHYYRHGILSNDYIRLCSGTINVSTGNTDTARNRIHTVNAFIADAGSLTITANGQKTDDESKGIKVEGSETTGTGKGYIVINAGTITITSYGKAITAGWDIDEDATTTDTSDDPNPYVEVNGGTITLTTTGVPYETSTASNSPEGIEGKSSVTINGGTLTINTTDDCLNAGDSLVINGGYIYARGSNNDSIDCNGNLTLAGGVLVAIGSAAPEGSFDYDDDDPSTSYTFRISGGTFVGIGGNTARPNSVSQNVVVLGSLTSGTTMAIMSGSTTAFAYTIPQSYATMILSSPKIVTGTSYTIYTGGTASGDDQFNGLYLGTLGYSGGTAGSTFTATSGITKLGGVYF